jgi:PAS domain S-box-containing protein
MWISYRYRLSDPRGFEFVSENVVKMIGYTRKEHQDDPDLWLKIVHPDFRQRLEDLILGRRPVGPMRLAWIHRDGRVIWTEQFNVVVPTDDPAVRIMEGTVREVAAPSNGASSGSHIRTDNP